MNTIHDLLWPLFIGVFLGGTAIPCLAVLGIRFLKKSSASTRHRFWTATAFGLLVFPLGALTVRDWFVKTGIPTETTSVAGQVSPSMQESFEPFSRPQDFDSASFPRNSEAAARKHREFSTSESASAPIPAAKTKPNTFDFNTAVVASKTAVVLLWLMGIGGWFVAYLTTHGRVMLFRLRRRASGTMPAEMSALGEAMRRWFRIRRPVRFELDAKIPVPLAMGVFRPIVLFPLAAQAWPVEKIRSVLLHELAHIARADLFWQNLVQLARIVYWFHPLVWFVARQVRVEQELACDDMVLESGERGCDYADVLLDLAKHLSLREQIPAGGLAMIRKKTVTQRIESILDPTTSRRPVTRTVSLAILFMALFFTFALSLFAPHVPLRLFARQTEVTQAAQPENTSAGKEPGKKSAEEKPFKLGEDRTITIRGRVLLPDGSPAGEMFMSTNETSSLGSSQCLNGSDKDGNYSINVHVGAYVMAMVTKPMKSPSPADGLASSVVATIITDPPKPGEFDIRLRKGIKVFGKLTYDDGSPAGGRNVSFGIYPFGQKPITTYKEKSFGTGSSVSLSPMAEANRQGEYSIALVPGEYVVTASDQFGENRSKTITLKPDDKELKLDFTLPNPTRGRVTLPDGTPCANLEIYYGMKPQKNAFLTSFDKTDAEGNFALHLAPLGNLIQVSTKDGKFGIVRVVKGDERLQPLPLTLQPPAVGKVRLISEATGKPIAGHRLYCAPQLHGDGVRGGGMPEQVVSDNDGNVLMTKLFVGGEYELHFHTPVDVHVYPALQCRFIPQKYGEVVDLGEKRVHGDFSKYEPKNAESEEKDKSPEKSLPKEKTELEKLLERSKKEDAQWREHNRGNLEWSPEEKRKFLDGGINTATKILGLELDDKSRNQIEQSRAFWIRMIASDDFAEGKKRYELVIAELEKRPDSEEWIDRYRSEIFMGEVRELFKSDDYEATLAKLKEEIKAEFETDPKRAAMRAGALVRGIRHVGGSRGSVEEGWTLAEAAKKEFIPFLRAVNDSKIQFEADCYEGELRFRELVGKPLDLQGVLIDGQKFDWNAYHGSLVIVYFDAPTSDTDEYCSLAYFTEAFKRVDEKYRDKGLKFVGYGMVFPSVRKSLQYTDDDLRKAMDRAKLPGVMISGNKSLAAGMKSMNIYYGCSFSPCVLLVDRDGKVLSTRVGHVHKNFADKNGEVELDWTLNAYFGKGKFPFREIGLPTEAQRTRALFEKMRESVKAEIDILTTADLPKEKIASAMGEFVGKLLASDERINESRRARIQADLVAFITKRLPENLAQEQRRVMVDGTIHFMFYSLSGCAYSQIPNRLENLRWRIATVLRAQPLSEDDKARLKEQLDFMRKFVAEFQSPNITTKENGMPEARLVEFEKQVADPFCPFYKRPFDKQQWEKFRENLEKCKSGYGSEYNRTRGILANAVGFTEYPTQRNPGSIELTEDGPIMDFRHPAGGSYVNLFAYDNDSMVRRTFEKISDPGYWPFDEKLHNSMRGGADPVSPPPTRAEAKEIARTQAGDFIYDGTNNQLVGVEKTVFALLPCEKIEDADKLSDGELQKLLDEKGTPTVSMKDIPAFQTFHAGEGPRYWFIAVRNGRKELGVFQVTSVNSMAEALKNRKTSPEGYMNRLAEVNGWFFLRPVPPDALPDDHYDPRGIMRP